MTCLCRTERMYYKDAFGRTREAPGGYKLRCAQHVREGRATDEWVRRWLAKYYPRAVRLALPAPEVRT